MYEFISEYCRGLWDHYSLIFRRKRGYFYFVDGRTKFEQSPGIRKVPLTNSLEVKVGSSLFWGDGLDKAHAGAPGLFR